MAVAGPTSELIYRRLKALLLDGGLDHLSRLDISDLATRFGASPTPVREAVMRLLGEGLLEPLPSGGTKVLSISEMRLRMLIEMHGRSIDMALDWLGPSLPPVDELRPEADYNDPRLLFSMIVTATGNIDLLDLIERLADRLSPFRRIEPRVFTNLHIELAALRDAASSGATRDFRRLSRTYHRRRAAHVADLTWQRARSAPHHTWP